MELVVEAYPGYKGEETPRALILNGIRVAVAAVVDRWYTETHTCFRVLTEDGSRYVLRLHLEEGRWELVMQEVRR